MARIFKRKQYGLTTNGFCKFAFGMKNLYRIILALSFLFFVYASKSQTANATVRPDNWAEKINLSTLHNFYKVDADVYRSEQPDKKGMHQLDSMGIKTVINLKQHKADNDGTKMVLIQIPMNAGTISYADIVTGIKAIMQAKKPILVHCKHGADRTGCIIAAYRIIKCGWTKEEAIKELREGGFGYHEKAYPNIIRLLNSLDIEKLKIDVL
jgi:protein tyrosine/serine phosphatase